MKQTPLRIFFFTLLLLLCSLAVLLSFFVLPVDWALALFVLYILLLALMRNVMTQ
jgi:hypothetical protein